MLAIFDFFNAIGLIIFSFLKEITEEEIDKNIGFLKKYEWFQEMLEDEVYKKLIKEDTDVRFVIGRLNTKKMVKTSYHRKYQIKIAKVLLKRAEHRN